MDKIDRLYQCYEILLAAGEKKDEHIKEFKEILDAVNGSTKEKHFAAKYICTFVNSFPDLFDDAIDAQVDLCEDDDAQIQEQAIKNLPKFCIDSEENVAKVAAAFAQLLLLRNSDFLELVNDSLCILLRSSTVQAFAGICIEMSEGDFAIREAGLKFIGGKLFELGRAVVTTELKIFIVNQVRKLLLDVSCREFVICMRIMAGTKLGDSLVEYTELFQLATVQANLNGPKENVQVTDAKIHVLIRCASAVMLHFRTSIRTTTSFIKFICDRLLPLNNWSKVGIEFKKDELQLRFLKLFAEICASCEYHKITADHLIHLYRVLLEFLPLPPVSGEDVASPEALAAFKLPQIECLVYALHKLGKRQPEALSFMANVETNRDFRKRLQYLASGLRFAIKRIKNGVKVETTGPVTQATLKQAATNISLLIGDLFHAPPIFKQKIKLSWLKPTSTLEANLRQARITSTSTDASQRLNNGNEQNAGEPSQNQNRTGRIPLAPQQEGTTRKRKTKFPRIKKNWSTLQRL